MTNAPGILTEAAPSFLDRARLRADRQARDGTRVPAGAAGTVVAILGDGRACIVEFTHPVQAVLTVRAEDLTALR
ncbi:DUF4926 domain-containing protein [Methylobacterium radiodurans]|uniref:DUF4926 domain-containing protein n=1 Tax=Methylobacterium radiodurans TaxID=2202828 RepID=A0A2U8VR33_9HYPH|nr:DUF4926 domain-containing protein [Methylobacterium radiodurans]AWN36229.1 DUF4926 domain-containing protein [Methylobacterium radiodurans]